MLVVGLEDLAWQVVLVLLVVYDLAVSATARCHPWQASIVLAFLRIEEHLVAPFDRASRVWDVAEAVERGVFVE